MAYNIWFLKDLYLFAFTPADEGNMFPFIEGEVVLVELEMGSVSQHKTTTFQKDPSFRPDLSMAITVAGESVEEALHSLVKVKALNREFETLLKFPWEKENFLYGFAFSSEPPSFVNGERLYIPLKVFEVVEQNYWYMDNDRVWWGFFEPVGEEEFGFIRASVKQFSE